MSSEYANVTVRANSDGSRDYYQHDSRRGEGGGAMSSRGRHRSRGNNNRKHPGYQKNRYALPTDVDGDVNMGGDEEPRDRGRFAPYANPGSNRSRGGGNFRGRGGGGGNFRGDRGKDSGNFSRDRNNDYQQRRGAGGSSSSWRKIIIPHGKHYGKELILRTLSHSSSVPFVPINFGTEGDMAFFYVQDGAVGYALEKLNKKLNFPDGCLMVIYVRGCPPPGVNLKDSVDQIKACVARRYNQTTGYLDLSHFHQDIGRNGIYAPLCRTVVAMEVVKAIKDNIPNITCLSLAGNKMSSLNQFGQLIDKIHNMKSLLLDDNLLGRVNDLDCFQGIGIEELTLKGNPMRNNRKSQTNLVDELRKRFPKLLRLDGEILPPQIGFDIETVVSLPPSRGSFFGNEDAKRITVQFIEQYYAMYDSSDRQPLFAAYHDSAIFALSTFSRTSSSDFGEYIRHNRNLTKVIDSERRQKLLFRGKVDIVACLKRLPKTQHDLASFIVDVTMPSATMMCITTSGVFKDDVDQVRTQKRGVREPDACLRAFNRTSILISTGSGYNIIDETLLITNPTSDQMRTAFKTPAPTPSPSPIPGTAATDPQQLQQQMITAFSQQSGMTIAWSMKCLQDQNWDYDKAANVFTQLNATGSIPREAFLQP